MQAKREDIFKFLVNSVCGIAHWNKTKVANALGVGRQHLSALSNGKKIPNEAMMIRMEALASEVLPAKIFDKILSDYLNQKEVSNAPRLIDLLNTSSTIRRDEEGNVVGHQWDFKMNPRVWKRMQTAMKIEGYGDDIDGYLASLIDENFVRVMETPENQMTEEESEAN